MTGYEVLVLAWRYIKGDMESVQRDVKEVLDSMIPCGEEGN